MCETLHRLYSDWESSADVHAIILKGAGGKAFCAGGDVKGMVQLLLAGQQDKALRSAPWLPPCFITQCNALPVRSAPCHHGRTSRYAQEL